MGGPHTVHIRTEAAQGSFPIRGSRETVATVLPQQPAASCSITLSPWGPDGRRAPPPGRSPPGPGSRLRRQGRQQNQRGSRPAPSCRFILRFPLFGLLTSLVGIFPKKVSPLALLRKICYTIKNVPVRGQNLNGRKNNTDYENDFFSGRRQQHRHGFKGH